MQQFQIRKSKSRVYFIFLSFNKLMSLVSLLEYEIIDKSMEFVVDHLIADPNYNYFNDTIENQAQEKYWEELLEIKEPEESNKSEIQNEGDEVKSDIKESKKFDLTLERRKLIVMIFSFHNISSRNYFSRFDKEYMKSETFELDIAKVIKAGTRHIASEMERRIKESDKLNIESITDCVEHLFSMSWTLKLPIPLKISNTALKDGSIKQNSKSNFTYTIRNIFEDHFQIEQNIVESDDGEIPDSYLDLLIEDFKIDAYLLAKFDDISFEQERFHIKNESTVSQILYQYVLKHIGDILDSIFSENQEDSIIGVTKEVGIDLRIIPNYGFVKSDNNTKLSVPIEIKNGNIFDAYKSRKSNPKKFLSLFNQVVFQLASYGSNIGIALDLESIFLVQLRANQDSSRSKNSDGGSYFLNSRVKCMKHFESKYNSKIIILILLHNTFKTLTNEVAESIKNIMKKFKLPEEDKTLVKQWQLDFLRSNWISRFQNYVLNEDGDYVHPIEKSVIIPGKCFIGASKINWDTPELKEEDFDIGENMHPTPITSANNGYFSRVSKVKFKRVPNNKKDLVLKVYNPAMSSPRGVMPKYVFLETYSFIISSYLLEVQAYNMLSHASPLGISEDLSSVDNTYKGVNYIPHLYQTGFCEFKNAAEFQGMYLLQEFIKPGKELPGEELFEKASIALNDIHGRGVLHGDVHPGNFIYNSEKDRVFFIDFGFSRILKFRNFKPSQEKSLKIKEMMDLAKACGVRGKNKAQKT
ncbi:hypothetical protein DFJ63DRAFT_214901 [Scheffersomyces coipomensis]|uniref:uncharacterized protein n=1 Tax=Scheffersomyces coipomensis TaxID=1788519 RepID=UPI00315D0FF0